MPNWVDNNLFVTGDLKRLKAFDRAFKGYSPEYDGKYSTEKTYTFNTFVPVPKKVLDKPYSTTYVRGQSLEETQEQICGYNWQIANWGTKWDVVMNDVQKKDDSYFYCFDTAWSVPLGWYLAASAKFPDLEFETDCYEESGMFNVKLVFKAGELIRQEELENPWDLEPEEEEEEEEELKAEGTA